MTCTWSNILKNNSSQFKSRFAKLYEILKDEFLKIEQALQDNNLSNKSEIEILNNVFNFWDFSFSKSGDITAKSNQVFLHSAYNPKNDAKKVLDNFNKSIDKKTTITNSYIFASLGIGYTPLEFAKTNNEDFLIIVEPNPIYLIASMCILDWTNFFNHEKCAIITNTSADQAVLLIESLCNLNNAKIVTQNSLTTHEENWYKTFFTLLERNKQKQLINNATLEKFSTLWVKNSTKNIKAFINASGINIYKNFLNNKIPSVVIAAGPSLQDCIPYLKQIQHQVIFIAVDTALKVLLKNNIEPDFVILIDPQYYAACHLQGLCAPSAVLITESSVYPSVLRFKCRKKVFIESLFPLGKLFEQNILSEKSFGKLIAGGSVSTTCFDFAKFIGSKEIYFAGLDLGYPKKLTHIKGSTFEEKSHSNSTKLTSAEKIQCNILFSANNTKSIDYQNQKIITDSKMKLFAWWFESQIAKNPKTKTFSLSKKSLQIPGIEYAPIEKLFTYETIKQITNFSKQELIQNAEDKKSQITKEKFEKVFFRLIDSFSQINELAKNALDICNFILNRNNTNLSQQQLQTYLEKLTQIDSKILSSDAKDAASLVFPTEEKLSQLINSQKEYSSPFLYNINKSKTIYEQILKSTQMYLNMLK